LARLIYTQRALADIEALTDFLVERDPIAAAETAGLLNEAISILAGHPLIGRPVEQGLRELMISRGHTGYVALYRFRESEDVVTVLSIRHQRDAGYWRQ
jgi:plasmid stabilization system protein ParE